MPLYILYLLAAAFLWGTSFVAGKFAIGMTEAPLVVLIRFMIASVFWLPVFFPAIRALPRGRLGSLTLLAFLMIPVTFLLQFIGLHYTTAASTAVMIGFEPLMFVLVGWLLWGERLTALNLTFGALALTGVLLVMGWPQGAQFAGCALVLLSTAVVAVWVRWSKPWMKEIGVKNFTALTTVIGTVLLVPFTAFLTTTWEIRWSGEGTIALLYLGVGCSFAAGWCWNKGIEGASTNTGGLFLALEPVFGVVVAALLLGEALGPIAIAGAGLVILPVVLSAILPWLRPRPTASE
ncbi:DMT family transporter [Thioclava litoralis]|uniref:DMT family transporter n=1 Tax=Thioclava litoralis TaxID=3076557 RepID=A0ABZ1DY76_9RHOB|nr:DMT family transporter [Thioclava sp. FTW29]